MNPPAPAGKKSAAKAPRRKNAPRGRRDHSPLPDPRPPVKILAEEVLLTKAMLAKILGYRSVRSVDHLVADDCVSESPCLKPIYLRRPSNVKPGGGYNPSFKSVRFTVASLFAYAEKMQLDFPEDLEWKVGGAR